MSEYITMEVGQRLDGSPILAYVEEGEYSPLDWSKHRGSNAKYTTHMVEMLNIVRTIPQLFHVTDADAARVIDEYGYGGYPTWWQRDLLTGYVPPLLYYPRDTIRVIGLWLGLSCRLCGGWAWHPSRKWQDVERNENRRSWITISAQQFLMGDEEPSFEVRYLPALCEKCVNVVVSGMRKFQVDGDRGVQMGVLFAMNERLLRASESGRWAIEPRREKRGAMRARIAAA